MRIGIETCNWHQCAASIAFLTYLYEFHKVNPKGYDEFWCRSRSVGRENWTTLSKWRGLSSQVGDMCSPECHSRFTFFCFDKMMISGFMIKSKVWVVLHWHFFFFSKRHISECIQNILICSLAKKTLCESFSNHAAVQHQSHLCFHLQQFWSKSFWTKLQPTGHLCLLCASFVVGWKKLFSFSLPYNFIFLVKDCIQYVRCGLKKPLIFYYLCLRYGSLSSQDPCNLNRRLC